MITIFFGMLLAVSIIVILYMVQKNYETIDIRYWSIVLMIPVILLGYWMKTRVNTPEGAMVCFGIIYLDSTILLTTLLFCIFHFMHIRVKSWIKIAAYGIAAAHMAMIWLCMDNQLYYKSITLIQTNMGTATKMTSGPLKAFHWIYLAGIMAVIVIALVTAFLKKGTYSRRTLWLYTSIVTAGILIYIVEILADVDFSVLPVLYVVAEIMIAVNYDHAHMHEISSLIVEQQESTIDLGYVAFDLDRQFLGSNEWSRRLLPELSSQVVDARLKDDSRLASIFYDLIDMMEEGGIREKEFNEGNKICRCELTEFTLRKRGKPMGYLFVIRDVTQDKHLLQMSQDYSERLKKDVDKQTSDIKNIQRRVVLGLANMVENRDNNTGGHVKRTSDIIGYIVDSVRRQGIYDITDQFADDIVRAAPMHDLGKITIENAILLKPGKLTDEEYDIMKTHSVKSGEFVDIILKGVEEEHFVSVAHNVARHHHERWDGRGYPEGLVGEMIPLEARIMAIADVYDALVSKRCYKKAMSFDVAANIMLEGMGTQFDPNMYNVFLDCREQLEKYYSEN